MKKTILTGSIVILCFMACGGEQMSDSQSADTASVELSSHEPTTTAPDCPSFRGVCLYAGALSESPREVSSAWATASSFLELTVEPDSFTDDHLPAAPIAQAYRQTVEALQPDLGVLAHARGPEERSFALVLTAVLAMHGIALIERIYSLAVADDSSASSTRLYRIHERHSAWAVMLLDASNALRACADQGIGDVQVLCAHEADSYEQRFEEEQRLEQETLSAIGPE